MLKMPCDSFMNFVRRNRPGKHARGVIKPTHKLSIMFIYLTKHSMNTARACWKLVRLTVHITAGLWTVVFIFPKLSQRRRQQRIMAWTQALLSHIAIKLVVIGKPPSQGPVLLAANHISWLDIVVIMACCSSRFVAKSEVRQWPLIGTLAGAASTLFIARASRRDALRVVHRMAAHLQSGDVLAIFPEGTTSNGLTLLPFHANLFQAAISANAPVQPVALQFLEVATGVTSLAPRYIDDDTLLGSIWRTLTAPPLYVEVTFGEPQWPNGRNRRAWAMDIHAAVQGLRGPPVAPPSCAESVCGSASADR